VKRIPTRLDPDRLPAPLRQIANKHLHWLPGWLRDRATKALRRSPSGTRHLLFALCDHFEPLHGDGTSLVTGLERVARWRERYPRLADRFRDASGRRPRHSFFFPGEQYDPTLIEPIAEMVQMGLGEVEIHLHHENDTRQSLRSHLEKTVNALATHGLVPHSGVFGLEPTIDYVGPMARTVEDVALSLSCLAGRDGFDPRQADVPASLPGYTDALSRGVKGLRIGLLEEGFGVKGGDRMVDEAVMEAVRTLERAGARVTRVSVPLIDTIQLMPVGPTAPGG
jgi:hypothetical protein